MPGGRAGTPGASYDRTRREQESQEEGGQASTDKPFNGGRRLRTNHLTPGQRRITLLVNDNARKNAKKDCLPCSSSGVVRKAISSDWQYLFAFIAEPVDLDSLEETMAPFPVQISSPEYKKEEIRRYELLQSQNQQINFCASVASAYYQETRELRSWSTHILFVIHCYSPLVKRFASCICII